MSSPPKKRAPAENLEQTVTLFLQQHPNFFDRYPELLKELELPHQSGNAVSLIERQVKNLRAETAQYRQQLDELITVARENEQLNQRLHTLTLTLIQAVNFDEVIDVLQDKLHEDFRADAVEVHLFSAAESAGETNPELDGFREFLDAGMPLCGPLSNQQLNYLFGPQAEDIRSAALIPIRGLALLGLLAFGSHSEQRFLHGMGTDFLTRLGEIVSKTLEVVQEPGF